jgi:hypothetical protein
MGIRIRPARHFQIHGLEQKHDSVTACRLDLKSLPPKKNAAAAASAAPDASIAGVLCEVEHNLDIIRQWIDPDTSSDSCRSHAESMSRPCRIHVEAMLNSRRSDVVMSNPFRHLRRNDFGISNQSRGGFSERFAAAMTLDSGRMAMR